ncbi:hypothetical protein BQ8794_70081 [Mesorhizobium prunaredense]|uniref:Uncharacterized protein n=1 Tax=Mesorhizobium prunaredense TaxID=1631249 RepID=A0A1R3VH47_9HYPH|nr:hypothetical protein BQ8794_70081 [Mesorhizobium prunaredense]
MFRQKSFDVDTINWCSAIIPEISTDRISPLEVAKAHPSDAGWAISHQPPQSFLDDFRQEAMGKHPTFCVANSPGALRHHILSGPAKWFHALASCYWAAALSGEWRTLVIDLAPEGCELGPTTFRRDCKPMLRVSVAGRKTFVTWRVAPRLGKCYALWTAMGMPTVLAMP